MSGTPTNDDLHKLLLVMDTKQDSILEKLEEAKEWQEKHEERDVERFGDLHDRINGLLKYAASISVVATGVGVMLSYIWNRITGKA